MIATHETEKSMTESAANRCRENAENATANPAATRRPRLIVTADDFGRSPQVNAEIERYCAAGVLTQASLMINEEHVPEALRIAQRHPGLCIGLHLTLCDGRASALSPLTDPTGRFCPSPARAGLRYAFTPHLRCHLSTEIERQFSAFLAAGLPPTYWDGHTHLHLHPLILELTLPIAARHGFRAMRLVREPASLHPHALIFRLLSRAALPALQRARIHCTDRVYGLTATGRIDTHVVTRLLATLPAGWSELYFHPGAEAAPIAPADFARLLAESGVQLGNSTDLIASSNPGN